MPPFVYQNELEYQPLNSTAYLLESRKECLNFQSPSLVSEKQNCFSRIGSIVWLLFCYVRPIAVSLFFHSQSQIRTDLPVYFCGECYEGMLFLLKRQFNVFAFKGNTQLAFYVNLHRAVIGPSATLTGR